MLIHVFPTEKKLSTNASVYNLMLVYNLSRTLARIVHHNKNNNKINWSFIQKNGQKIANINNMYDKMY